MHDYGIKRNGEGYADPTAFQAITNMAKPGEIWTYQKNNGTECEVVIINNLERHSVILNLQDTDGIGRIIVHSKSIKYTDPGKLNWVFNTALATFVKKMPDEEFEMLLDEIQKELNLASVGHCEAVQDGSLLKENEALKAELADYRAMERQWEDCASLKLQLQTYKVLYNELIQKILEKQVG